MNSFYAFKQYIGLDLALQSYNAETYPSVEQSSLNSTNSSSDTFLPREFASYPLSLPLEPTDSNATFAHEASAITTSAYSFAPPLPSSQAGEAGLRDATKQFDFTDTLASLNTDFHSPSGFDGTLFPDLTPVTVPHSVPAEQARQGTAAPQVVSPPNSQHVAPPEVTHAPNITQVQNNNNAIPAATCEELTRTKPKAVKTLLDYKGTAMLVREAAKGTQEAYQRIEQTLSTHDYTVGLTQVNPTSDFDYPLDFEVISGREIPAPPDPNHGNKKRKVKLCLLKDQIGRIEADIEIINENVHMLRENIWRSFDRTPSPAKRTNKLFAPGIVDETVVTGPLNGEKDLRREHNLRTHVANRALRGQAEAFIAVLGLYGVNRWEMPPLIERYVKPSKSKKRSNYKERQDKCRHETAVWEEENTQLAVQDAMLRRMLSEMRSALEKTVGGASHAVRPVELAQSQQQSAPPLLSDAISWNPAVIGRLGIR